MNNAQNTAAQSADAVIAPATNAVASILTAQQVQRILMTRRLIDDTMVGQRIDKGLAIVGRGNATKNMEEPRVVYNTNAMRRNAMAEAAKYLRDGKLAESIGDQEAAQQAFRLALNTGVITFSQPADWTPFPANALITAHVESFIIKAGPDAGKTGLSIGSVKLIPGVTLASDANSWADLLGDDPAAPATSVPQGLNAASAI